MKRFGLVVAVVFALAGSLAADTTTTNAGLTKPDVGSTAWGPKINTDLDLIDSSFALLSATNTFTGTQTFSNVSTSTGTFTKYISVGDGTAPTRALIYGGGDGAVNTIMEIRNSGTSGGVGTGSRIDFVQGLTTANEQGSLEFWDEGSLSSGETFNLYLSPNGSRASRYKALRISGYANGTGGGLQYWFGPNNTGTSFFDFKGAQTIVANSTPVMRISPSNTNSTGDLFQVYAPNDTTQRLRVSSSGHLLVTSSETISGADGLTVTFGVSAATITATSFIQPGSRTLAQFTASTPTANFQMYGCSDCATDAVCVGTQTVTSTWARTNAKTTRCQ